MDRIVQTPEITIYQGRASEWQGDERIDLVFTNPYGYLPLSLANHPMVIHQWSHRKPEAELWTYNKLDHWIGLWNDNREAFWSSNVATQVIDIHEFRPEPGGWYPEEMVRRLLSAYVKEGQTVWDGFMGRGTIAKICRELGVKYVGVEILPEHVTLALTYLELST